jgi:hypothetical protein
MRTKDTQIDVLKLTQRVEMLEAHSENLITRMYQAECEHDCVVVMEDPTGNEHRVCQDCEQTWPA